MTANINQQFVVEITRTIGDAAPVAIAPNLAASITSWEREFNEEEEPEDERKGFLLPEDQEEEEGDDEEGDEDDAEDEDDLESDSTLYVTATLNKEVLREIKELQNINAENLGDTLIKISFVYGNDQVGTIRREFEVDPDLFLNFGSGNKEESYLIVGLTFDVYNSDTVF